ncbi:MAG: DNA internalization-related competence protein ComEC/Rec2 [Candidatus Izemoplasmatales bacterium]|nr:DNA internalization-related competence protein ComEC/Rec2 [Candidatus Izemoplasmatales bacterium]
MKKLKTILLCDTGYFIHLAIVMVLTLISINHLIVLGLLLAEVLYLWSKMRRLFYVALFFVALLAGSILIHAALLDLPQNDFYEGTIIEVADNNFVMQAGLRKIIVYHDDVTIKLGDKVRVSGDQFSNKGYRISHRFEYRYYLASQGIAATIYADDLVVTGHSFHINSIKTNIVDYFKRVFSQPVWTMMVFILFGDNYLADETTVAIQRLGISHLFAISGMHIALIVGFLDRVLKRLYIPKKAKEIVIISLLCFYMILTGFAVSVVRAVLIVVCIYVKEWKSLPFSKLDLMSFILMLFLLYNPFLIHALGFQLSFLIAFAIVIGKDLLKTTNPLVAIIKITIYANLIALPILLEVNKEFNYLTIPANLIFVVFFEKVMLPITFLVTFIPSLEMVFAYVIDVFETGIMFLAQFDTAIKFNFASDLAKVIYFLLILSLLIRIETKRKCHIQIASLILLVLVNLTFSTLPMVTFVKVFDVGQGDAIYLHDSECDILIDTGDVDDYDTLITYFKGENITHLDQLIITHDHSDHCGEIHDLLAEITVGEIIVGKITPTLKDLDVRVVSEGDTIGGKYIKLTVLSAYRDDTIENNNSLVLYGRIGFHNWLFMGDAETEVEKDIIKHGDLAVDIIKIGHHGSNTSSTKTFIAAINATGAIISVGQGNSFGHPDESVISRLDEYDVTVFRTDQMGTITFVYLPLWDRAIVTKDDRDNLFNNDIARFLGFF